MFISHGIWLLRTRDIQQRAKAAEIGYDDFPEAVEWQGRAININFSRVRRKTRRDESDMSEAPV